MAAEVLFDGLGYVDGCSFGCVERVDHDVDEHGVVHHVADDPRELTSFAGELGDDGSIGDREGDGHLAVATSAENGLDATTSTFYCARLSIYFTVGHRIHFLCLLAQIPYVAWTHSG